MSSLVYVRYASNRVSFEFFKPQRLRFGSLRVVYVQSSIILSILRERVIIILKS
jgi:hypothetical protein